MDSGSERWEKVNEERKKLKEGQTAASERNPKKS